MTRKEMRAKKWLKAAEIYAEQNGCKIRVVAYYQIRLIGLNKSVDLYPVSEKYNVVGEKKYPAIESLERFLKNLSLSDTPTPIPPEITSSGTRSQDDFPHLQAR